MRRLGQGEEAGTSRGSRENKEPKLDEMVSWPHKLHLEKYFHFAEEQRHTLFILNVYTRGSQGKPDTSTVSKPLGGPHGVQRLRVRRRRRREKGASTNVRVQAVYFGSAGLCILGLQGSVTMASLRGTVKNAG